MVNDDGLNDLDGKMSNLFKQIEEALQRGDKAIDDAKWFEDLLDCKNCPSKDECEEFATTRNPTPPASLILAKQVLASMPDLDSITWESIEKAHDWLSTVLALQQVVREWEQLN